MRNSLHAHIIIWFRRRCAARRPGHKPVEPVTRAADNPGLDPESLELKLHEAVLKERPEIESGLNLLKIIAMVAPLLGLLGTVTGMIITFQMITLFGAGDPKAMAGGISQALITPMKFRQNPKLQLILIN